MNYKELNFTIVSGEEYVKDLLIAVLGEIGFDTFEETALGFNAYIQSDQFNEETVRQALEPYQEMASFSYDVNLIPYKNWNQVWESNFEPLLIDETCYIRATFHEPHPEYKYEIVIDPKMAFGTGHHQTTTMMIQHMLKQDFTGQSVLDMGCGTGILAILAEKLGAKHVVAIDYDPICYDSTLENAKLNNCQKMVAGCGSKESIPDETFDTVLANINRNILLDQIDRYAEVLKPGGKLYLSGFYETPDLEILIDAAKAVGLKYHSHLKNNDWVSAEFSK